MVFSTIVFSHQVGLKVCEACKKLFDFSYRKKRDFQLNRNNWVRRSVSVCLPMEKKKNVGNFVDKMVILYFYKCEKLPHLDRIDSHQGFFVLHLSKRNERLKIVQIIIILGSAVHYKHLKRVDPYIVVLQCIV